MGLFKDLTSLMNISCDSANDSCESVSLVSTNERSTLHVTAPSFIDAEEKEWTRRRVYYISDLHLVHHIINNFTEPVSDDSVFEYIHSIVLRLFSGSFDQEVRMRKKPIVLFGGDISSSFAIAEAFYRDFISTWEHEAGNTHPYVYAILGNHELWDFDSYGACETTYRGLFNELGVVFLHDTICPLGHYRYPERYDYNPHRHNSVYRYLPRAEDPKEYDRQTNLLYNIWIVGGLGFVNSDSSLNANHRIYGSSVNREEELKRCDDWRRLYNKAKTIAKEKRCCLVVLTHTPITAWGEQESETANCVFINGHTHHNMVYTGEKNNYIFADNQVGYTNECFRLKEADLYMPRNPFASDPDGYREITCDEFKEYHRYVLETNVRTGVPGTGVIEWQISHYGAKLYVIKQDGYIGFFVLSSRGVYICNGGQIRKISSFIPIDWFHITFKMMVNKYIAALSPLRSIQEQLSTFIKSFGGSGRIHGTIVDIDFENHVMVNTYDRTLTPYHSPIFGYVTTYSDIGSLIRNHCPDLKKRFRAVEKDMYKTITSKIGMAGPTDAGLFQERKTNKKKEKYVRIDIKNSQYAISRRINALQRLFEKRILRDWNQELAIALMIESRTEQENK